MKAKRQAPREEDRLVAVEISEDMLRVTLQDGRIIATPLDWYPRPLEATPEQRANHELTYVGAHWPDLDKDLSVSGMLQGNRPPQPKQNAQVKV